MRLAISWATRLQWPCLPSLAAAAENSAASIASRPWDWISRSASTETCLSNNSIQNLRSMASPPNCAALVVRCSTAPTVSRSMTSHYVTPRRACRVGVVPSRRSRRSAFQGWSIGRAGTRPDDPRRRDGHVGRGSRQDRSRPDRRACRALEGVPAVLPPRVASPRLSGHAHRGMILGRTPGGARERRVRVGGRHEGRVSRFARKAGRTSISPIADRHRPYDHRSRNRRSAPVMIGGP